MGDLRYCSRCKRNVSTELKINWIIVLLFTVTIIGIIYLIICFTSSNHKKCPYCGSTGMVLEAPKYNFDEKDISSIGKILGREDVPSPKYCSGCGILLDEGSNFCKNCGKKVSSEEEDILASCISGTTSAHAGVHSEDEDILASCISGARADHTPSVPTTPWGKMLDSNRNASAAAALSILVPGLGSMYSWRYSRGAVWLGLSIMSVVVSKYVEPTPMMLVQIGLYIASIVDAYLTARTIDKVWTGFYIDRFR